MLHCHTIYIQWTMILVLLHQKIQLEKLTAWHITIWLTERASMNAFVPDLAMVPKLLTKSALVMPIPVSWIVRVLLAGSGVILMCRSLHESNFDGSVRLSYLKECIKSRIVTRILQKWISETEAHRGDMMDIVCKINHNQPICGPVQTVRSLKLFPWLVFIIDT